MKSRKIRFFLAMLAIYGVLLLLAAIWPDPFAPLVAIPFLFIYLFHTAGIPGLLQNNGLCGWGWCAPSLFGWLFLVVFWLAVTWGVSSLLAGFLSGKRQGSRE